MPPPGFGGVGFDRYSNSCLIFLFLSFFDFFLKGVFLIFCSGGGSAPNGFWGEVGDFSGRGLPPVGFGGRGDFVSRLRAGGGGGDIAIRNPFPGERSC